MKSLGSSLFLLFLFSMITSSVFGQICLDHPVFNNYNINPNTPLDSICTVFVKDIDCDGTLDILTGSYNSGKLSWFKNNGNPFFLEQLVSTAPISIRSVYAEDMDADGDIDLLAADPLLGRIYLYRNNGGAAFSLAISLTVSGVQEVSAVDVDRDGDMDIAYAANGDDEIGYWEQDGINVYNRVVILSLNGANSVEVVDFNKDGHLDFIGTGYDAEALVLILNDGNQNFSEKSLLENASGIVDASVYDMDNDGDLDCVVALESEGVIGWVEIDGNDAFYHEIDDNVPQVAKVTLADINGDGAIDILAPYRGDKSLFWFRNDGNLNFSKELIDDSLKGALFADAADFDADGDLDVVSGSPDVGTLKWYQNTCTHCSEPLLTENTIFSIPADQSSQGFPIDLDCDGDMDVVSVIWTDEIYWLRNNGSQVFTKQTIENINDLAYGLMTSDIDKDGDEDVFYTTDNPNHVIRLTNNGNQNFTPDTIRKNSTWFIRQLLPVDLDQDGDLDIVANASTSTVQILWYKNDGNANFSASTILFAEVNKAMDELIVEDIDKDGDYDIIGTGAHTSNDGTVYWLKNDGSQNFTDTEIYVDGDNLNAIKPKDFDQDGDLDLIIADFGTGYIEWLENINNVSFAAVQTITPNANGIRDIELTDIDLDGDLDVAFATTSIIPNSNFGWYENTGFSFIAHLHPANYSLTDLHKTDMDNDGDVDFLLPLTHGDKVIWFENTCDINCGIPYIPLVHDPIPSDTYHAEDSVYAEAILVSGTNAQFKAGISVKLGAGFHARAGSDLEISIEDCSAAFTHTPDNSYYKQATSTTVNAFDEKMDLKIAPNPTQGETSISYQLTHESPIYLSVYNLQGSEVQSILSGMSQDAGAHQISFFSGDLMPGIYLIGLRTKNDFITQKLVVLK